MGSAQGETHAAFFYGSLMAHEVFLTVCYRASTEDVKLLKSLHQFQPAVLHGYRRRRVKDADYPGITPDPDHEVRGFYVSGLTDANMYYLDQYEESAYDRKILKVRLLKDDNGNGGVEGEEVECNVYVYMDPTGLDEAGWDYQEFRTHKMKNWTRPDYYLMGGDDKVIIP
ncbi:AIG2-like family-domain-containing protein [Xylaria nigripes]|nr:AIG2-like family-domain-containing protein [Xylaria nigripes]